VDMHALFGLLKIEPAVLPMPDAPPLVLPEGRAPSIEFRNVHFGYQEGHDILKGMSFTVPGGQTLGVVGSSGSGKSTVMRLLNRFYDYDTGGIYIEGQEIRALDPMQLRTSIGVVPQDTVLLHDTIRHNIHYGDLEADDDAVRKAAVQAQLHSAIAHMPKGMDTIVGERGLKLSGGEKQRVAIARTILKGAPILLCDEATSALDAGTEKEIMQSLHSLAAGRTAIVIAHRLSTVMHADRIIVLAEGKVVEEGTHADLVATPGGIYADLWAQQQDADWQDSHEALIGEQAPKSLK